MAIAADGRLHIYFLNVGQGDTTVIVTPNGRVIVIDAARPDKLCNLLNGLGASKGSEIELLVITHPHIDHYSGAGRLVREYRVAQAVFCPFWNSYGMGPFGYRQLVADLYTRGARCQFLSGYSRLYPDAVVSSVTHGFSATCKVELLGPSNGLVTTLEQQALFDTNHLSIMARITWESERFILAADAQMENWALFDSERMAADGGNLLRAAHHGSGNGTQWERLSRLAPTVVVVSSDLTSRHSLPDVTGAAVFARYSAATKPSPLVVMTGDAGTIRIIADGRGTRVLESFLDSRSQDIDLTNPRPLTLNTNPTDWKDVLIRKANSL